MDTFGFCIIQTLVTDIEPAAKVKAAMNEINAATRMRSAAAQKAEAEKIQVWLPPRRKCSTNNASWCRWAHVFSSTSSRIVTRDQHKPHASAGLWACRL